MKRLTQFVVPILVACAMALPAPAAAQAKPKPQLAANVTVKSVAPASLVVTGSDCKDMTFTVDAKTNVVGKGVGTKSREKGGKATIADLLGTGDRVTVTYHDMGGTLHASKVELTAAAKKS